MGSPKGLGTGSDEQLMALLGSGHGHGFTRSKFVSIPIYTNNTYIPNGSGCSVGSEDWVSSGFYVANADKNDLRGGGAVLRIYYRAEPYESSRVGSGTDQGFAMKVYGTFRLEYVNKVAGSGFGACRVEIGGAMRAKAQSGYEMSEDRAGYQSFLIRLERAREEGCFIEQYSIYTM
ncbi:hypothetical protein BYT27DRAFT_7208366 [Phlegmacium glaucopus]|nr:hypothetical protein BYT27DRAFT_7208366 [Phlegmacium glaucopus]